MDAQRTLNVPDQVRQFLTVLDERSGTILKSILAQKLGQPELRKILDLELNILQQRVFNSPNAAPFGFSLTDSAKEFVLREGTERSRAWASDPRGARRLASTSTMPRPAMDWP